MNRYETPSKDDSVDHLTSIGLENLPPVLDYGLSTRPPFVETSPKRDPNLGGFVDEGNATLLKDDFSICCEAYFHWRHNLEYSPHGEYPEDTRVKLLQHIASEEFLAARTLFLSAIEQDRLPELSFLLWELYAYDPNRFTESLLTLRALQSSPRLSKIESPPLCRNEWLKKVWDEEPPYHWIMSPYEYGLNYFLYRELQIIDQSPRFMLPLPEIQRSSYLATVPVEDTASNDVEDEASANDAYIRLLFGVAGCGKTKSIFDTLSSNWGLYILPGRRSESLAGRTLQSDSILLWFTVSEVIEGLGNICEAQEIRSSVDRLVDAFLACRLREFKRMYQTSDFDRQAEFHSVPTGYKYSPDSHDLMHNVFQSTREFKLDHTIQKDLEWKIILAGTSSYVSEVTRAVKPNGRARAQSDVYYEIQSKFEPIKNFQDEFPEFLLAHIDHVFSEAWAIIKTTYESRMAISSHRGIRSERISDADGDMDSSTWDCLQSSGLLITSGRHVPRELRCALLDLFEKTQGPETVAIEIAFQRIRDSIRVEQEFITKIGLPLRGRHLWSSRYTQLILAIAIGCYIQPDKEDFRTKLQGQVAEIERKVIDELISNLKKLRKTNRLIYSHICRLAIRADALNKPTLFPSDYTGEMVTQGFAFAYSDPKNSHWKEGYVKIGEPLAIRAVFEYLQTNEKGKVEFIRQINEIVYINQDNASGFGFSTEYYLATNFDCVFRRGVELISADRRDKVRSYLQKNFSLIDNGANSRWTSSCKALHIGDFELIQPAIDDHELGKASSFVEWLEQPRGASKFCFPSTKAGPDLAFVLNRNSNINQGAHQINRILVAVQCKTAEQKTQNGFDVTSTIHTIDPNLWQRCEEQHPTKPSDSNDDGGEHVRRPNLAEELLGNLPNINYAFCCMDREMTQDLFGDAFTKLIDMAKKKPVKRSAPGDDNVPDATEGPQTKKLRQTPQGPRHCGACRAEGHMRNSPKCPQYQQTLALRKK
ncbi:MAG: hypothetical protein Q9195_004237 [Heterodermia aff. obscurata]